MPYTTKLLNFKEATFNEMARTHQTPRRSAAAAQSKRKRYSKKPIRFRPGTVALREIR